MYIFKILNKGTIFYVDKQWIELQFLNLNRDSVTHLS